MNDKEIVSIGKGSAPKIVKLISLSGAVINAPNCSQLIAVITTTKEISYTDIITYVITKRYPVNVYFSGKEYPEGLMPQEIFGGYLGKIAAHTSNEPIYLGSNTFLVNGTLAPRKEWFTWDLLTYLTFIFGTVNYPPSLIVDTGPASLKICSNEAGGYVAMLFVLNSTEYNEGSDNYGFYRMGGHYFEYPSGLLSEKKFVVKELILNIPSKYNDSDHYVVNGVVIDPLKYVMVNSGYDFLLAGIQTSAFDPRDLGWDTIQLNGTIYVNPVSKPSNKNDSRVIIKFSIIGNKVSGTGYYSYNYSIVNVSLRLNNGEEFNWNCTYREYFKKFFGVLPKPVLIDQIVFPIPQVFLGVSGGENIYVYAEATFIAPNDIVYSDSYSGGWVEYIYMPVKNIVNSWISGSSG